jgi:hypothetical protein
LRRRGYLKWPHRLTHSVRPPKVQGYILPNRRATILPQFVRARQGESLRGN